MAKFLSIAPTVVAIAFLAFIAGSYTMFAKTFPSEQLSNAYRGGMALWEKKTANRHPFYSRFHYKTRTDQQGVTVYDAERAANGFTLYTSGHDQIAQLITMDGNVVHEWRLPYGEVWDETAAVKEPIDDQHIYFRRAQMFPNGDLLVIYEASGDTPYGYGLVRMDKNSKVIWKYLAHAHHDFDIGVDGKIYVLTQEIRQNVIDQWQHIRPPRMDDFLVVLSPEGEELKKVAIIDALVASPFGRMLVRVPHYLNKSGDYLHTNAVDVIEDAEAAFPFAKRGQVLISMRELGSGALAVLDLEQETITWAYRGSFVGQHDPDILPNGNILLFDNRGHYGEGGASRVIEIDPRTEQVVWSYTGDAAHPFDSVLRSAQERLPNGNTLITESDAGRLFEVTPEGEIVWEFYNPVRGGEQNEFIPVVSWGLRIDPKTLDPDFIGASSLQS